VNFVLFASSYNFQRFKQKHFLFYTFIAVNATIVGLMRQKGLKYLHRALSRKAIASTTHSLILSVSVCIIGVVTTMKRRKTIINSILVIVSMAKDCVKVQSLSKNSCQSTPWAHPRVRITLCACYASGEVNGYNAECLHSGRHQSQA